MPVDKYNRIFNDPVFAEPVNIELWCFANWVDTDTGGLGRYQHLKNAISMLWPDMEFNDWFELRLRTFCDPQYWVVDDSQKFLNINSVGCAASGKTHDWVVIGFAWWLADPCNSRFSFCSAQKQMIEGRSWAVLQQLYNALPQKPGHMINSKHILQSIKGDSKHCIDILASSQGETEKAVQRLAGNHPKRYMIVVDEASDTPEAIFQAVTNASKACEEFVFAPAGNAWKRMDPLGRCSTPAGGWTTVDRDTEIWQTQGVREWDIKPGVTMHFSGRRSPNVKKGRTFIRYLYTLENWLHAVGNEGSLNFWRQDEGFWAPEGITNTVLDEATIIKARATDSFEWESKSEVVGALDPAFGGDDCKLKFGELGDIDQSGRLGLEVKETVPVIISDRSKDSVEMQIAKQVIKECEARGVKPECFGLDATGTGRGIASYLQDMWSPMNLKVEFGGSPTDAPVSQDDPTNRKDAYDRKVTELAFTGREAVIAGQLRGLDPATVNQFTSREYNYRGKKIVLEPKDMMKKRIGRSPDDMDCVMVMVAVAESRGMVIRGGEGQGSKRGKNWLVEARKYDAVYEDNEQEPAMSWFDEDAV